jgi:DNA-binding PadR family transcriptional regulator
MCIHRRPTKPEGWPRRTYAFNNPPQYGILLHILWQKALVFLWELWHICYVTRSTSQDVAQNNTGGSIGHYSDPPLLVLASLADGPKHGHAMVEDIAQMCGTRLGPGTLYGAITRLEQQRLIEPLSPEERRQPYRITRKGMQVLRAKLTTLQQFSRAGLRRLEAE